MCDWLSHGKWCDVNLLCSGHSFKAHKAVLASVSAFLRRMLLSVSTDDSDISIILPDFDLDAMTSVLYYIYHGEVTLEKQKLETFFEVTKALQIYVDGKYFQNKLENNTSYLYNKKDKVRDIYTLCSDKGDGQLMYNIKKCIDTKSIIIKKSRKALKFHDKNARCRNEREPSESRLGNLKSPFGDRQRNSFLRDLFIETYPRNGNVNGRTEGVLAISNECYRSPASVLSTNANGEHLNDDALSTHNTSTNYSLHSQTIFQNDKQTLFTQNYNEAFDNRSKSVNSTNILIYQANENISTNFLSNRHPEILPHSANTFSALHILPSDLQKCMMNFNLPKESISSSSVCSVFERVQSKTPMKAISSKVIYNQVLQSPWCSQKPNDFKPFRRKNVPTSSALVEKESDVNEKRNDVLNDSNNNVESSQPMLFSKDLSNKAIPEENMEISTRISVGKFTCSYCNQVFASSDALVVHARRHSTNPRYSCSECGKTFSQLRNFKYHMSIHRGTKEFAATCTVCGKYFNDRGYLSSHMKIHRNRKEYKCSQCPKSFNQRVAYNMHVRIHTGVKPHVCEECGKAFSRKMLLKQHQRTHSGERPYACPHCDKRFADRSNMTLHLRLHTGVKPFSCTLCPKSFTKKHHLKSHLNFHTGSKPYSCPRCKLAFTQSSNMRTHMKKCNAPEPTENANVSN